MEEAGRDFCFCEHAPQGTASPLPLLHAPSRHPATAALWFCFRARRLAPGCTPPCPRPLRCISRTGLWWCAWCRRAHDGRARAGRVPRGSRAAAAAAAAAAPLRWVRLRWGRRRALAGHAAYALRARGRGGGVDWLRPKLGTPWLWVREWEGPALCTSVCGAGGWLPHFFFWRGRHVRVAHPPNPVPAHLLSSPPR